MAGNETRHKVVCPGFSLVPSSVCAVCVQCVCSVWAVCMQCVCSVYAACEQCVGSVCALCVPPIETANDLPDDIDKWLTCFPQAKPCFLGGDTYMALLIGLSVPFPKLINLLSTWMRNK